MRATAIAAFQLGIIPGVLSQNASIIQTVDPTEFGIDFHSALPSNKPAFQVFNSKFLDLIGPSPSINLIVEDPSIPLFHEAGVYFSSNPTTLFATSNQYNITTPSNTTTKTASISIVTKQENGTWTSQIINESPTIPFVNGGFKYKEGILFDAQGSLSENGGLTYMEASPPYKTTVLLNSYFGIPFASPNDVFITSDGAIWFTDNPVGFTQGIRPAPELGGATYRFVPNTTELRIVNDDFKNPNGITFSPDEKTAYITAMDGLLEGDKTGKRTIYAFDVSYAQRAASGDGIESLTSSKHPFLTNKRPFALVSSGIPDGLKCDTQGNLWAGVGDGVSVWDSMGVLLGKVLIEGGAANFVLGKGEVFAFNEQRLYLVTVASTVVGNEVKDL